LSRQKSAIGADLSSFEILSSLNMKYISISCNNFFPSRDYMN